MSGAFSGFSTPMSQPITDDDPLYESWMIQGTYFSRMLDRGDRYNQSVQNALEYLPREILYENRERLAFVAMGQRDGCRLARVICENREVIILAEHIMPKRGTNEGQPEVRYFIFVVLHEIVHAIKKHRSPLYDSLSAEEVKAQEDEADNLALQWFNDHINALKNPYLKPLTREEVEVAEARNRAIMDRLFDGT